MSQRKENFLHSKIFSDAAIKRIAFVILLASLLLSACAKEQGTAGGRQSSPAKITPVTEEGIKNQNTREEAIPSATIVLDDYFQGLQGCAVIYDHNHAQYFIYNPILSDIRSSPCSTFKIAAALAGIEADVLKSEAAVLKWNGTKYPLEAWNQDLTLKEAFHSSCIWYFRTVINETGKEAMQTILPDLSYGNCDISEWEGSGTNAGSIAELNGFWLKASLLISPKAANSTT